jgi:CHAT domain-containing protein/Tfp pilus assembly protein PilF
MPIRTLAIFSITLSVSFLPMQAQAPQAAAAPGTAQSMPAAAHEKLAGLVAKLTSAQAAKDLGGEAAALNEIGSFYSNISEFKDALDSYNHALTVARDAKDTKQEAVALSGAAGSLTPLGHSDQAQTLYSQALEIATASGDRYEQAVALSGMGWIYANIGQLAQALDFDSRALTALHDLSDREAEAAMMSRIGMVHLRLGETDKALELLTQALPVYRTLGNRDGEAMTLMWIGIVDRNRGEVGKALDDFNRALAGFREAGDRVNEAATLNDIGLVYSGKGEAQKALDQFNKALSIQRDLGDSVGEALAINNIGIVYKKQGELQKALDDYNEALHMFRQAGDRSDEAGTLMRIGNVYLVRSEFRKALELFIQAQTIQHQAGERVEEARVLNNMGSAYDGLGEPESALNCYTQALSIYHEVGERNGEAIASGNVGRLYAGLAQPQKALEYYTRALPVYREVGNRDGIADTLNEIGKVYHDTDQPQKALDSYRQALQTYRELTDREGQANVLGNMAEIFSELNKPQEALDGYNNALSIVRDVGDRSSEAYLMAAIGLTYSKIAQRQKALEYYTKALPIAIEVGNPILKANVAYDLMGTQSSTDPAIAIFFGKQAVNFLQGMRGNMQGLDAGLQKSFLVSKENYYRDLAKLLIDQGRLPEAQQVLDLLKQQEYTDYVRGDSTATTGSLSLTPAEEQAQREYEQSTAQLVSLSEQWAQLGKVNSRTLQQEQQYEQISAALATANDGLNDWYNRLYKLLGLGGDANRQVADIKGDTAALREQVARMPHTVALYTMVTKDRYIVLVITGKALVAREYVIPEEKLNEKVAAFQQALRTPAEDPRLLGQELYRILIGPAKADLDQAHAQTLVWSLDGVLRYIPMAALFDGKQYLIENFNLVAITPASIVHLNERSRMEHVSAVAMGISRQYEDDLQPLPAVVNELDDIVKDSRVHGANGVLPGSILLNGQFTERAMETQMDGQHSIVHIASHFVFRPGDDRSSYLLLAGKDTDSGGYHLTVADFRDNPNFRLSGTVLLTLSACETGLGGNAGDGREVDGLATTAQLKGTQAVLSSLWEVNDTSTGKLMADFYRRWANGKVMKVEALREAQLDLLRGNIGGTDRRDDRGITVVDAALSVPRGFTHPFYWAPFVLIGNWK